MYAVDHIVSWRERGGIAEFEVNWAGYSDADNTWEPYQNLTRFSTRSKAHFLGFVRDANDERLWRLLPGSCRGTGGRGRGRAT